MDLSVEVTTRSSHLGCHFSGGLVASCCCGPFRLGFVSSSILTCWCTCRPPGDRRRDDVKNHFCCLFFSFGSSNRFYVHVISFVCFVVYFILFFRHRRSKNSVYGIPIDVYKTQKILFHFLRFSVKISIFLLLSADPFSRICTLFILYAFKIDAY